MRKALFTIISLICILICDAVAQEDKNLFWMHTSFGGYTSTVDRYGNTAAIGLCYVVKENIYSIRGAFFEEHRPNMTKNENQKNINLLFGRYKVLKFGSISYSAGIGLTNGVKRGVYLYSSSGGFFFSEKIDYYENHTYTKPSIPIEFNYLFPLSKIFSSGISIYSNLNSERNYLGIGVFAGLGKFRN